MIEVKITDLPSDSSYWVYRPPRITEVEVRPKGAMLYTKHRISMVEPLVLHIGDTVRFGGRDQLPKPFVELLDSHSGHPVYAVATKETEELDVKTKPAGLSRPVFVGNSD